MYIVFDSGGFETADVPLAEVPERIERALKESYSFKTFSYTYSPYVIIERLYDYERGKFGGVVVKGFGSGAYFRIFLVASK